MKVPRRPRSRHRARAEGRIRPSADSTQEHGVELADGEILEDDLGAIADVLFPAVLHVFRTLRRSADQLKSEN